MKKNIRKFASDDIVAIEQLAEQLASELESADLNADVDDSNDVVAIEEDADKEACDVVSKAEELMADAELPDDKQIVGDDEAEKQAILAEAEEIESVIADAEKEDDAQQVIAEAEALEKEIDSSVAEEKCPDCGKEKCECAKTASEIQPGIEDKIGDEANGGDPSVSDIVDNDIDVSTDKEVFGQNTDSEYVAKITARLDRVATALEKRGMKKMAFRVDQLSDRLEASVR